MANAALIANLLATVHETCAPDVTEFRDLVSHAMNGNHEAIRDYLLANAECDCSDEVTAFYVEHFEEPKPTVYWVTQTRWLGGDDWTNQIFVGATLEESQAKALESENEMARENWRYVGEVMGSFLPDEDFEPYESLEAMQDADIEFYFQTDACE
jgi:hypothetical protein